jgi:hypothetical protein
MKHSSTHQRRHIGLIVLGALIAPTMAGCYRLAFGNAKWADPMLVYDRRHWDHEVYVQDADEVDFALSNSGAPVMVAASAGAPGDNINTDDGVFRLQRGVGAEVSLVRQECEDSWGCATTVITEQGEVLDWTTAAVDRPASIGLNARRFEQLVETGELSMQIGAVTSTDYDTEYHGGYTYRSSSAEWLTLTAESSGSNVTVTALRKPRRWIGWLGFLPTGGLTYATIHGVQQENYAVAVATGIPAFALGWWSSIQAFRSANRVTLYEQGEVVYP